MTDTTYTPPEVWTHDAENGGKFANINRPTAGAREEKELPRGDNPHQLYSLATPNGVKANIIFEELLEAGHSDAEYDAWIINIGEGVQFTSGFVDINPNSKIPAMVDHSGDSPIRVFESGAILMHMAEKFGKFLPTDAAARAETLSWLFWQVGSAPFIGGGFGHFYAYAPEKYEYPINRYAMETKRLFDVANNRLKETRFLAGDDYTIADMAAAPWLAPFTTGEIYGEAKKFLSIDEYEAVNRWASEVMDRPAVKRAKMVNRTWGDEDTQVPNRHSSADFDGKAV
ncbi:glutathione-dependent disulfide-bond oxidoreductase [Pontixanthobacter aestiaquae]|uniref:Glutathione-dependent disulfide-bond oxidoreductase n=1 Tax=Pontixanthobacter aestiaquae TaxID=1509367 RepID=A0A844ZAW5_9SPHN|nr:glutathione-dependent disulfide-bond oxidoreductase [Pontixanthobacter aestiaquae]MDN3644979.1 glutathione-dependent disulfide-bond oxidoreductase [Pontixanthobacter aestiaquae]MXO84020.1 glutathione-dependent disulfide-bond oxidoreductase [Pontixanthobacter aestiaquae]